MWTLAVTLALAAAPAPHKLGTTNFQRAGMSPETAALVQEALTNRLASRPGLEIITPADIAALLGQERQKQLLGCSDSDSSCAAELGGALGVEGLLTGSIGKVGDSFQLNVKVVSATDARPIFVYASKPLGSEGALLEEAALVAELIAARLLPEPATTAPPQATWQPFLLMGGGVLLAGGGTAFALLAKSNLDALNGAPALPASTSPESVRSQGQLFQGLSIGLFAAGGVAIVAGLIWKLAAPNAPLTAEVAISPSGASASLRVQLP